MAALLVALGVMAVALTVAMPVWKQMGQREKEEELVFRGKQYARAIGLYQRKFANAFPPSIDVLVEQRFLRKKYKDPITNADFVPLVQGQQNTPGSGSQTASRPGETARTPPSTPGSPVQLSTGTGANPMSGAGTPSGFSTGGPGGGPIGGIVGVTSKSKDKSIRIYNGRTHYNEWAFVFTPQVQSPGAGGAATPGAMPGGPGQRGGQGSQGGNPFNPGGGVGRGGQGGQRGGGQGNPGGPGRSTSPFGPQPTSPTPGRSGR